MADAQAHWDLVHDVNSDKVLEYNAWLRDDLSALLEECKKLSLKTSSSLLLRRIEKLPESRSEFELLLETVEEELKGRLFLFVPPHLAGYYERDNIVSEQVKAAFLSAFAELRSAGTAFSAGLNTASVFHSMRAAEIGVRALATALKVTFSFPIELAEWGRIVSEIEPKIKIIEQQPRSTERDQDLEFYGSAAAQLRYFNDGWRIRVAHARAIYDELQARIALQHAGDFFETIAIRLRE
jgi:hypothetical protein